jgi:hypothetical protein
MDEGGEWGDMKEWMIDKIEIVVVNEGMVGDANGLVLTYAECGLVSFGRGKAMPSSRRGNVHRRVRYQIT